MIFQSGASKLRNLEKSSKMVNNLANNVEKPCSTHYLSQKPDFRELLHHQTEIQRNLHKLQFYKRELQCSDKSVKIMFIVGNFREIEVRMYLNNIKIGTRFKQLQHKLHTNSKIMLLKTYCSRRCKHFKHMWKNTQVNHLKIKIKPDLCT